MPYQLYRLHEKSRVVRREPRGLFLNVFGIQFMILQLIWVKLMVPETKGISLEEIEKELGTY